jgi:hypothetical protein
MGKGEWDARAISWKREQVAVWRLGGSALSLEGQRGLARSDTVKLRDSDLCFSDVRVVNNAQPTIVSERLF